MIRQLAFIRELRIAHHQRQANALGAGALAAQRRRDFARGAALLARSIEHRSKRDELAARRAPAARPDPVVRACCTGNCRQGRDCPVATPDTAADNFIRAVKLSVVTLVLIFTALAAYFK